MHDLTQRKKYNTWNLWVDLTYNRAFLNLIRISRYIY